ncbi:response regulator [Denitrobaculum tricleocarpae]|uniref:Response regulator n=1 Tax=Denitrobaculum tricleocarpae TaxID=2591009 RepID=A0A545SYQ7_9PROT|nr:response regulator [Denitrobaculum tricleocarpae]TQV70101.1 response regulator [Denitrobaculum tricleocarpae]
MSISSAIAPHLPYLRRYARALTGSQASGDAYVAAVLEALIADPASFPADMAPKTALFHVFTKIWNSAGSRTEYPTVDSIMPDQKVDSITPRPRQAFLLTAVEQFEPTDVAQILDVTLEEVTELADKAALEIAQQLATEVMIIEDEPIIAMDLESLVEDLGHSVTGTARTHKEAVALAVRTKPGLILADIQLADGSSGLDAINEILGSFEVPVIFITAYPERLLTGERPEPTFLITKPFQPETIRAVVSQALFFGQKATHAQAPSLTGA